MKNLILTSLTLALGLIAFAPGVDASDRSPRFNDSRGDFHRLAQRRSGKAVRIKNSSRFADHRISESRLRRHRPGIRHHRIESRHFRRGRYVRQHRRVIVSHRHHGIAPGGVIAGAVIGGVIGHELGHGHAAATAAGVLIGSALGHELSH